MEHPPSRRRSPLLFSLVSLASVSAYLWVRIPAGREVQHSFANFCANVQMKPQDWPCQVTPARSIAFYLVASLLVWLAVAVPALFVPIRLRARTTSWNRGAREIGLLTCAAACLLVVWGARQLNLVPSGPDWLASTREWFTPAAFMFVFASLLGTNRRWWPWIFAPVGILLSLGLSDALLAALSRSEAFGSIGASAPYAAVGLIASLWRPVGDVIARRRV